MPSYAPTPVSAEQRKLLDETFARLGDLKPPPAPVRVLPPATNTPPPTARPKKAKKAKKNKKHKKDPDFVDHRRTLVRISEISKPWMQWEQVESERGRLTHTLTGLKVYALVDPRDNTVRYVGRTTKDLEQRLQEHLTKPTNNKTRAWFASLDFQKQKPAIRLITHASSVEEEIYWIAKIRRTSGLLNIDPGGHYRNDRGVPILRVAQEIYEKYYRTDFGPPPRRKIKYKNVNNHKKRLPNSIQPILNGNAKQKSEYLAQAAKRMMLRVASKTG